MTITPIQIFTLRVLGSLLGQQFNPEIKTYLDALADAAQANANIDAKLLAVAEAFKNGQPMDWAGAHEDLRIESAQLQA